MNGSSDSPPTTSPSAAAMAAERVSCGPCTAIVRRSASAAGVASFSANPIGSITFARCATLRLRQDLGEAHPGLNALVATVSAGAHMLCATIGYVRVAVDSSTLISLA
jgi:hypothetical protein